MKKVYFMIMAVVCVSVLASCSGNKANTEHEKYAINLFEQNKDLAEVWWGDDFDETQALQNLNDRYNNNDSSKADTTKADTAKTEQGGGCCSWRKGNFHGRNIDWTMRNFATLIIHMPKNESKGVKYASVGLIAGNPTVTEELIQNNKIIPEKLRATLPALVVDGMNECGLTINQNVVPYDGKPYVEKGDMPCMFVIRYLLDHCATAKEAIDSLQNKKVAMNVVKIANDYSHFMLSDPTSTYVVEWIDGQFVATEFKSDGKDNFVSPKGEPAVMTNYFVAMAEKYGLATPEFFKEHPTGAGVERTQLVYSELPNAKTLEDHFNIAKSVWYRQFCQGKAKWYSENAGNYGFDEQKGKAFWFYPTKDDMHWMDNDDVYGAAKALYDSPELKQYFKDFNEKWDKLDPENTYWFTQHTVIYDLKELKGHIIMQEGINGDNVVDISVE